MSTTRVLITIDTEAHRGKDPVKNLIWGRLDDGEEVGINYIMDACEKFGFRGTFFVDIAEVKTWGKTALEEVVSAIRRRGHDVQLHVHPDHWLDSRRRFLWQYSIDEQRSILQGCVDVYRELCGEYPVGFRAGAYGANYDTLKILKEVGVKLDFSMFYRQSTCHLNDPPLTRNAPVVIDGVVEIPVTTMQGLTILSSTCSLTRFEKLDVNVLGSKELQYVLDSSVAHGLSTMVIFLHSFSFVRRDKEGNSHGVDQRAQRVFEELLRRLSSSDCIQIVTAKELSSVWATCPDSLLRCNDAPPRYPRLFDGFVQTVRRSLSPALRGTSAKAQVFLLLTGSFVLLAMLAMVRFLFYLVGR